MSTNDLKGRRMLILNVPDNLTPAIESPIATMEDAGLTVVRMGDAVEAFRHVKNEMLAMDLREALIVHKSAGVGMSEGLQFCKWPNGVSIESNAQQPVTIEALLKSVGEIQPVRIDKTKDRFSFADHFVGRGKRRIR